MTTPPRGQHQPPWTAPQTGAPNSSTTTTTRTASPSSQQSGRYTFYWKAFLLCFRFNFYLQDRRLIASVSKPTGWTHLVLNYLGPSDSEGIKVYRDGAEGPDVTKDDLSCSTGDGRVVIGLASPDADRFYGTFQIDELIFFNETLTPEEIQMLASV